MEDAGFDVLEAKALAAYRWGQYRIAISPDAKFRRRFPMEILAYLGQEVAPWQTETEFFGTIAVLHECVHYEQDVSTGLGHWDWLQRKAMFPEIIDKGRFASWVDGPGVPITGKARRELLLQHSELSWFEFGLFSRRREKAALAAELRPLPGYEDGLEERLTLHALLELEAVLVTMMIILQLKSSGEQYAIQKRFEGLWNPDLMPGLYRDAYLFTMQPFVEALSPLLGRDSVLVAGRMVLQILDISLNVPPPGVLADGEREKYRPGSRFLHSLREMFQGNRTLPLGASSYQVLDALLTRADGIDYMSSADATRAWIDALATPDDVYGHDIDRWRADNCERRLGADYQGRHSLNWFIEGNPLIFEFPEGEEGSPIIFTGKALANDLYLSVLQNDRDMRLRDLLLARRRTGFRCPFVDLCDAATERCKTPYDRLDELPASAACKVRTMLDGWGWNFMPNLRDFDEWIELEPVLFHARRRIAGSADFVEDRLAVGYDDVLLSVALQVAVPVVTAFVSSALFDKYKSIGTRHQAEQAKDELELAVRAELAPRQAVVEAVVLVLVENGFGEAEAERIAGELYDEARAAHAAGASPPANPAGPAPN